jgi:hypothetical protein
MPPAAGATNDRKSDGFIHDGTARTASITPSDSWVLSVEDVDPDLVRVLGTNVATAGPEPAQMA